MSKFFCGFLSAFVLVVLSITPTFAESNASQDAITVGPKVGDQIPHPLETQDQYGVQRTFDGDNSLIGDNGLILLFVRSVDWCPFCKNQVKKWNENIAQFQDLGYKVAVVSYDPVEETKAFSDRREITFPLLSDVGSEIVIGWGVLNEDHKPGGRFYGIPHPLIFVIAPDGTITNRFSESSYLNRPDIDVVYETLASLSQDRE